MAVRGDICPIRLRPMIAGHPHCCFPRSEDNDSPLPLPAIDRRYLVPTCSAAAASDVVTGCCYCMLLLIRMKKDQRCFLIRSSTDRRPLSEAFFIMLASHPSSVLGMKKNISAMQCTRVKIEVIFHDKSFIFVFFYNTFHPNCLRNIY